MATISTRVSIHDLAIEQWTAISRICSVQSSEHYQWVTVKVDDEAAA